MTHLQESLFELLSTLLEIFQLLRNLVYALLCFEIAWRQRHIHTLWNALPAGIRTMNLIKLFNNMIKALDKCDTLKYDIQPIYLSPGG